MIKENIEEATATFPTQSYSGNQIAWAGEQLKIGETPSKNKYFGRAMEMLSWWRYIHEEPLSKAFEILQKTVKEQDGTAIFAKRLKRLPSIVNKLKRHEQMKLNNMQDIGGCRTILGNIKQLERSVKELKQLAEFRMINGKYRSKDYIKEPKPDGYRSYHIVGVFTDLKSKDRKIEIQLRTQLQHYWATALEIVDLFTGQSLKSGTGKEDWANFFAHTSRQFALMDSIPMFNKLPALPKKTQAATKDQIIQRLHAWKLKKYTERLQKTKGDTDSCKELQKIIKKLDIQKKFLSFAGTLEVIGKKLNSDIGYVLLTINVDKKTVSWSRFLPEEGEKAASSYTNAEKSAASSGTQIVALVAASKMGSIKEAYPNFFADSGQFMNHINLIQNVNIKD